MKTIEEYAVDMVASGAESTVEDDLNEDGDLTDEEHIEACKLGLAIVRAIREYPGVVVAMGRREQIEVPEADDSALFGLSVEEEIRAWALDSATRIAAGSDMTGGELVVLASAFAGWIETGKHPGGESAEPLPSPTTTDTTLWAVHVEGTDDLLPMADRTAAEALAAEVNATFRTLQSRADASELDPHFSAAVVEWDGTAEEHATHLAAFVADGSVYQP